MLELLFSSPLSFLFFIIGLLVAIDIHEFSHAWAADKLGDPTPRANGRLTLNPLAHLDPFGTLALFITRFGWGKPVPIDPYNLQNPRRDSALISLAGPASNLILAGLLSLVLKLPLITTHYPGFAEDPVQAIASPGLITLLVPIIIINVSLAIFNLLPIPPLDGSKILLGFLPKNLAYELEESLEQYGLILLLFILFPLFGSRSLASLVIAPVIEFILNFLL